MCLNDVRICSYINWRVRFQPVFVVSELRPHADNSTYTYVDMYVCMYMFTSISTRRSLASKLKAEPCDQS